MLLGKNSNSFFYSLLKTILHCEWSIKKQSLVKCQTLWRSVKFVIPFHFLQHPFYFYWGLRSRVISKWLQHNVQTTNQIACCRRCLAFVLITALRRFQVLCPWHGKKIASETSEEITQINDEAVPENTKKATRFGFAVFKGKGLSFSPGVIDKTNEEGFVSNAN